MCHLSRVMCHVSRVTCHMSHVNYYYFFWQCGEAYRWRVCYQLGLPRLVCTCICVYLFMRYHECICIFLYLCYHAPVYFCNRISVFTAIVSLYLLQSYLCIFLQLYLCIYCNCISVYFCNCISVFLQLYLCIYCNRISVSTIWSLPLPPMTQDIKPIVLLLVLFVHCTVQWTV